jgi:BMFP domain-containing protein YqiC
MAQTTGRLYDEFAKLMNDAAGVAQGVRREFDSVLRGQAERLVRDMDLVHREEFEAVKEMARLAREENEALKARIAALEAKIANGPANGPESAPGNAPGNAPATWPNTSTGIA